MNIKQFLKEYKHILLDEHREKIMNYNKYIKLYTRMLRDMSNYEEHNAGCERGYDTIDISPNSLLEEYTALLDELVSWYKKLQLRSK